MTRIVIGSAISLALVACAACSGSSSTTSPAAPSTAFSAQTFSAGPPLATLDHGHASNEQDGHEAQIEGAIVSIDAAHTSFVVKTTHVKVLAATIIRHGHTTLTFADLKTGDRVHVKGAANGTSVDAREVNVQDDAQKHEDRGEAAGVVAGLAGTCPAITFTVGAAKTKVTTNSSTRFGRAGCAGVVNGAQVEVHGALQAGGAIVASEVSAEHDGDGDKD